MDTRKSLMGWACRLNIDGTGLDQPDLMCGHRQTATSIFSIFIIYTAQEREQRCTKRNIIHSLQLDFKIHCLGLFELKACPLNSLCSAADLVPGMDQEKAPEAFLAQTRLPILLS